MRVDGVVERRLGTQAMLSESPAPRLRIAGRVSGEGLGLVLSHGAAGGKKGNQTTTTVP